MIRKENTMNSNREIRVMIFEPGKEPYTAVLEDSLEHRQALSAARSNVSPCPMKLSCAVMPVANGWAYP